jgi:hypothetical protein
MPTDTERRNARMEAEATSSEATPEQLVAAAEFEKRFGNNVVEFMGGNPHKLSQTELETRFAQHYNLTPQEVHESLEAQKTEPVTGAEDQGEQYNLITKHANRVASLTTIYAADMHEATAQAWAQIGNDDTVKAAQLEWDNNQDGPQVSYIYDRAQGIELDRSPVARIASEGQENGRESTDERAEDRVRILTRGRELMEQEQFQNSNPGAEWTLQQFGTNPAGEPWFALQQQNQDGVFRTLTGTREELDRVIKEHHLTVTELPPITEGEYYRQAVGDVGLEPEIVQERQEESLELTV